MTEILSILQKHTEKYPRMTAQDAVKLLYQRSFGGGHLITDEAACLSRLKEEYHAVSEKNAPLTEDIGGGMVRVDLSAAKSMGISPSAIFKTFKLSAEMCKGDKEGFIVCLDNLKNAADMGMLPFGKDELNEYLKEYTENGCPMVSHSEVYRKAYSPAYRVCTRLAARLMPVVENILRLNDKKERIVIAIEGRAASGKSTAADDLKSMFKDEACVIHMDDFFLPVNMRTPERYAEPGGNIHYERFLSEVLSSIDRDSVSYRRFDCSIGDYADSLKVKLPKIVIIEGSYSMHPLFRDKYDVAVFSDVSPHEQMERVIRRNGEEWGKIFKDKWIPLEERYFSACGVKEACHIVI